MGAYLSEPVTIKISSDKSNEKLSYGASGMQGWRVSMEDAHSCLLDYEEDMSLFAVYDGHGGSEVATYTAEHLPDFLKTIDGFKNSDLKGCLTNGFLKFDQHLLDEEVITELRELAGDNNTEEDSELDSLAQDAEIPITELLQKLKEGGYNVPSDKSEEDDSELYSPTKKKGKSCKENESEEISEIKCDVDENRNKEVKEKNGKVDKQEEENKGGEEKKEEEKSEKEVAEQKEVEEQKEEAEEEEEKEAEEMEEMEGEDDEDDDDDDDDEEEDDDDEEGDAHWGDGDEVGYDSGTTAVVALLHKNRLVVGNVGDSRCVLCRNGIAIDMSQDHKPENDKELARIKNAGGKVTGEGRVNGGLNLSRAIGDHRYKGKTDLRADEQQITAMPDVKETNITEADKFMVLACDGIWNVLSSQQVVDFVSERLEKQIENDKIVLSKICEELFDRCISKDTVTDDAGCDNMTAVIVLLSKDFTQKNKRKIDEEKSDDTTSKRHKTK